MLGYSRKKYIKTFYIAKSIKKAPYVEAKNNYWVNLEKAIIISISIIILGLVIFPRYFTKGNNNIEIPVSMLEVIDIPIIQKEEPPPPPPVKIIEPIKIVKIEEKNETKSLKDEIKVEEELKLDISDNIGELLLVDSQMGDITSIDFAGRSFDLDAGTSLSLEYQRSRLASNVGSSLSLDLPDAEISKKKTEKSIEFDTKSLLAESKPKRRLKPVQNNVSGPDKFIKLNKNQFLLKESESTIGTQEFKTWNRINAALDRLNKDRYGELPTNVRRSSNGLSVSFAYKNEGQHDIFWSKGGKVIIRVTGKRPKSQIHELQKAYDALLKLIYKLTSSAL